MPGGRVHLRVVSDDELALLDSALEAAGTTRTLELQQRLRQDVYASLPNVNVDTVPDDAATPEQTVHLLVGISYEPNEEWRGFYGRGQTVQEAREDAMDVAVRYWLETPLAYEPERRADFHTVLETLLPDELWEEDLED